MRATAVLALTLLPVVALAATGLKPGEYHDHVHVVVTGTPMAIPAHDADNTICVTAKDVADNGREFARMQNDPKHRCTVTNKSFTDSTAKWHLSCAGGVDGDSVAQWGDDTYTVTTNMTQSAGGMSIHTVSTVTGTRTGDCSG